MHPHVSKIGSPLRSLVRVAGLSFFLIASCSNERASRSSPKNPEPQSAAAIADQVADADSKSHSPDHASQKPPNILFVCSDAHRRDFAVGERGASLMPTLHDLARQGVAYNQAFSNASWTLPSIASIMTGRFPRYHLTGQKVKTGLTSELSAAPVPPGYFLSVWEDWYHQISAYPDACVCLPERLRQAGYTTALIAANPYFFHTGLHADGFDIAQNLSGLDGGQVNEAVVAVLRDLPRDRPVFLMVHYVDVHDFDKSYFRAKNPGVGIYRAPRDLVVASYEDAVRDADRYLAALLQTWNSFAGSEENMVVFYADHGEHLLDPGHPQLPEKLKGLHTDPAIDLKRLQYPILNHGNSMEEALLRVPLVVKYPARMKLRGMEVNEPVSLVDLFPTVLEVAGIAREGLPFAGDSLLKIADGQTHPDRLIFADYQLYGDEFSSVRKGPFKMVFNLSNHTAKLFDLRLPYLPLGEEGQISTDEAAARELRSAFEQDVLVATESTEALKSNFVADQKQAMKDLRALGYVR